MTSEKSAQKNPTVQELLRTQSEKETVSTLIKIAASSTAPSVLKVDAKVEFGHYDFIRARAIYELRDLIRSNGDGTGSITRKALKAIRLADKEEMDTSSATHNYLAKEAAETVLSKLDKSIIIANGSFANRALHIIRSVKKALSEYDF